MKKLEGKVALVAGATRGAGRGIACMLGEAGATVICTGRSVRGQTTGRSETIDETAEMVSARGGRGIAIRVDHTNEREVEALCERIAREHGYIDVLVNDIWGGDELTEWRKKFWELKAENARRMLETAVLTHVLTSRFAVPLMLDKGGLVVEITDGDFFGYRGNLYYDLAKMAVIRLAFAMAFELRDKPVTALALTPGFLRSEAMLELFGVTEENWRDGAEKDKHFIASETPFFVGRAVAALAADPNVRTKAGRVFSSWELAKEYDFDDVDGARPDWGSYFVKAFGTPYPKAGQDAYSSWQQSPYESALPEVPQ